MTERSVSVRLRMQVRDYLTGAASAEISSRRLAKAQRELGSAGNEAAAGLTKAGKAADSQGRSMGRGMLYAGAGVAALAAAGGALRTLPPVLAAAGTAAAVLPPALIGAAQAGGVLKVSLSGVGDAIKEVNKNKDPFANLTPNARALVFETVRLRPALQGFQQGLQSRALDGAARNLNALATDTLPKVSTSLNALATDWSDAFREITLAVMDPQFTDGFNRLAYGTDAFFDMFNKRIGPTTRSLMTLATSADPVARAVGQGLVGALDKFNAKVAAAEKSGGLDRFFERGAEGAAAFMDLANSVLTITGQVVGAAQAQGNSLEGAALKLRGYIASGRSAEDIAGIMNTLTAASEGLTETLGPLASIARDALADPGTAQGLQVMFDILTLTSEAARLLFDMFNLLPDPIQAVILAGLALTVMAGKAKIGLDALAASATRAGISMSAMGVGGASAGKAMSLLGTVASRAGIAFLALQVVDMVASQFAPAAVDANLLADAIERMAKGAPVAGNEFDRVFGQSGGGWLDQYQNDLNQQAINASEGWWQSFFGGLEKVPGVKPLNELIWGSSITGSKENFSVLDSQMSSYLERTGDLTGATEMWNRVQKQSGADQTVLQQLLPQTAAAMRGAQDAAHGVGEGLGDNSVRAKLMAGSFQEAAAAGNNLAGTFDLINGKNIGAVAGQIALEEAYDRASEVINKYGEVTKKGTNEIDLSNEKGRETMTVLLGIANQAKGAAAAEEERSGSVEAGIPILEAARERFIALATKATGSAAAAKALADQIIGLPSKDVTINANTEVAAAKVSTFKNGVLTLPSGKTVTMNAETAAAYIRLEALRNYLANIPDETINVAIRTTNTSASRSQVAAGIRKQYAEAQGGVLVPRQRGGVTAAANGLLRPEIYPASDPPLYQFAEKETGGELFLPRRGIDMRRGRSLLEVGARWYGGEFVPMAAGGVRAAAAGLVNTSGGGTSSADRKASRLDFTESFIRAKQAVGSLSAALKENGRSFSLSTKKGQENAQALISGVRAAQDAAQAKFKETGSVKAANAVYDEQVRALRRVLAQRKINASTINALLKQYGERPGYDTGGAKAPGNSEANIAFTKATAAAGESLADLRDKLSLNTASTNLATPEGRENMLGIIAFLETAGRAAQDRYEQTKSVANATGIYNSYVGQLRAVLKASGYSDAQINQLINAYGRITIKTNARGGAYMAAAGAMSLRDPALFGGGTSPLYGFAEKQTGGELFVPRQGDRRRGEDLLSIGAGWYGGQYVRAGASGAGATSYSSSLTVNNYGERMTDRELRQAQRRMDTEARIGRRR